jgi:hypothetical protein
MKMAVFWVVATCSTAEVYLRFRGFTLMMEAASTSETMVNFCQTTCPNNSEEAIFTVVFDR